MIEIIKNIALVLFILSIVGISIGVTVTLFLKATRGGELLGGYQSLMLKLIDNGYYNIEKALNGCSTCFCFWYSFLFSALLVAATLIILASIFTPIGAVLFIFFAPAILANISALTSYIIINKNYITI